MTMPRPVPRDYGVAAAMAELAEERRKLEAMQAQITTTTTTVQAKDRLLSVTLDGRGDLTKLEIHGTRYRRLEPGELAVLIVETIATGRRQAIEKLGGMMGSQPLPGIEFADLASGRSSLTDVLDTFLGAALEQMPDRVKNRVNQTLQDGA